MYIYMFILIKIPPRQAKSMEGQTFKEIDFKNLPVLKVFFQCLDHITRVISHPTCLTAFPRACSCGDTFWSFLEVAMAHRSLQRASRQILVTVFHYSPHCKTLSAKSLRRQGEWCLVFLTYILIRMGPSSSKERV
jgi:hypothetical protein